MPRMMTQAVQVRRPGVAFGDADSEPGFFNRSSSMPTMGRVKGPERFANLIQQVPPDRSSLVLPIQYSTPTRHEPPVRLAKELFIRIERLHHLSGPGDDPIAQ